MLWKELDIEIGEGDIYMDFGRATEVLKMEALQYHAVAREGNALQNTLSDGTTYTE